MNIFKNIIGRIIGKFNRLNFRRRNYYTGFSNNQLNTKRIVPYAILVIFALTSVGIVIYLLRNTNSSSDINIADAKAVFTVNKEFSTPLFDNKGKEVFKIRYTIETVEKRDEIIAKGQRARSVKGRTFLIVNIKIVNDYNQSVTIQSRDYIRISLNNDKNQWLAPDIHNDPIEIQAISTKFTRVGIAINDSDSNIVIRVGEINGPKEDIEINI